MYEKKMIFVMQIQVEAYCENGMFLLEGGKGTRGGGTKMLQHASNEREAKQEGRKLSNACNEHE